MRLPRIPIFFSYDDHNRLKKLHIDATEVDSLVYDQSGRVISFSESGIYGITKYTVSYLSNRIIISKIGIEKNNQSQRKYTLTINLQKDKIGRIELEKESCFEYDKDGDIYEKESCMTERRTPKDTVYANVYNLVGNVIFWQVVSGIGSEYGNQKRITFNSIKTLSIEPFDVSNYSTPVNKKYPKKETVNLYYGEGKAIIEYEYKKGVQTK